MVNIYTSLNKVPKEYRIICFIDDDFNANIRRRNLMEEDLQIIQEYEGLYPVSNDKNDVSFKSELGIVPLSGISTGLKALLLIRVLKRDNKNKYCVNITECGNQMVEAAFEEVSKADNIVLLLQYP